MPYQCAMAHQLKIAAVGDPKSFVVTPEKSTISHC
jgi:hypothetical protein